MAGLRKRLPLAFSKVTPGTCREIIAKVVEQENRYWSGDERLDEVYSANAEEEYAGQSLYEKRAPWETAPT
jgi:hypothetical protein